MTSERPIKENQNDTAGEATREAFPADGPRAVPLRRALTIADLDIETVQWLSDDLKEGFALYDPDDRLVVANAEYIRLHQAVADLIKPGMTFETMFRAMVLRGGVKAPVGEEEAFIAARVAQHRNPGQPVLRRLTDGSAFMIKETRLADGSIISRENDVSEVLSAKEALREKDEKLRMLVEIASDWFWETDEKHRITAITLQDGAGVTTLDGIIGRTRWEVVGADPVNDPIWAHHKADIDAHRPFKDFRYSAVAPTGMSTHFRVSGSAVFNQAGLAIGYRSMPKDDGGRRHFSITGVPMFAEDGTFRGYRGTSREITKEILSERRAALAHQRLLDAIEALPESFVLCDAEDRIVLCNSATYTRLPWCKAVFEPGAKFEEALREIAYTGATGAIPGQEEDWVRRNLEHHRAAAGRRQYRQSDGRWIQITERKTADGGTVVIRADITEEKRIELEREAALTRVREENRAISTLMANFTNELRAPLQQIARLASALRDRNPSGETADTERQPFDAIERAVGRALALVGDVLDISRIRAHRYPLNKTDVDIGGLIGACCAEARDAAEDMDIRSEIAPSLGSIRTDGPAMRRLLKSAIGIACAAQPQPGTVEVHAAPDGASVEIVVYAPGVEMPEVDIDRMMRPFDEMSEAAAYRESSGFGVELAFASTLSAAIGTLLSISSPPEGGVRLVLSVPRAGWVK